MFAVYAQYRDYGTTLNTENLIYRSDTFPANSNKIISLKLNMALNEAGTLEMTIPKDNLYCSMDLNKLKMIRVYNNSMEIWRGFESKRDIDFWGNVSLLFDGVFSIIQTMYGVYRVDSLYSSQSFQPKKFVEDFFATTRDSMTIDILLPNFILFKVGDGLGHDDVFDYYNPDDFDISNGASSAEDFQNGFVTLESILTRALIDPCGGYLRPNFENAGWRIEYISSKYSDFGKHVRSNIIKNFKRNKNLLDYKKTIDNNGMASGILPFGKGEAITISGNYTSMNNNVLYDEDLVKQYGERIKMVTHDDVTNRNILKARANVDLTILKTLSQENSNEVLTLFDYDISSDKNYILLPGDCFMIDIQSEFTNASAKYLCTECNLDLINPEKSTWNTGDKNKYNYTSFEFYLNHRFSQRGNNFIDGRVYY